MHERRPDGKHGESGNPQHLQRFGGTAQIQNLDTAFFDKTNPREVLVMFFAFGEIWRPEEEPNGGQWVWYSNCTQIVARASRKTRYKKMQT